MIPTQLKHAIEAESLRMFHMLFYVSWKRSVLMECCEALAANRAHFPFGAPTDVSLTGPTPIESGAVLFKH
jgi:hypothetical protein